MAFRTHGPESPAKDLRHRWTLHQRPGAMTGRSKRWFRCRARRHESGRSRLILHDGSAVSRAPGLLGRLRQCRWRPGMRRLYPNAWYRASARPARVSGGPPRGWCRARRGGGCRPGPPPRPPPPPAGLQLQRPPPGADLRRRGHEDLHVGVGEDDRADVAAVEHRARAACGRNRAGTPAAPPAPRGWPRPREAASPTAWLLSARLVETGRDRATAPPRRRVATSSSGCPASSSVFATAR